MSTQFLAAPEPPNREHPWVIRYVLADLDGTRMSSYSAFGGLEMLATWFFQAFAGHGATRIVIVRQLATMTRSRFGVELLLHEPEQTLTALAIAYAHHYATHLEATVSRPSFLQSVPGLLDCCQESFTLFPQATTFLQRLQQTRTAFGIFTATAPEHAVNRMIRAGEHPQLIQEIWTRSRCEDQLAGHFDWRSATTEQRAFLNLLRPYKESKPHPGPLRAVHEQYELAPESVLMIGEGCADLGCVLEHATELTPDSRLYARFAFQKQGAVATEAYAATNALLRHGSPLGLSSFDNRYPTAGQHPGIIILEHGFTTLNDMIDTGLIQLKSTPPPLRESPLAASGYRRSAGKAPQRLSIPHPIDVDD